MTPIKIIAKKIPKPMISNLKIHCFIDELTKKASTYSGFIRSENYWNSNLRTPLNKSSLYIISDWITVSDWLRWKTSTDREEIINQSKPNSILNKAANYIDKKATKITGGRLSRNPDTDLGNRISKFANKKLDQILQRRNQNMGASDLKNTSSGMG